LIKSFVAGNIFPDFIIHNENIIPHGITGLQGVTQW
jgi:hypothetical protein